MRATDRLSFRIPREKKKIIEHAAAVRGMTLTAFAVSTLYDQAQEVLRGECVTVLSDRDRDAFLDALDHPPKPNRRLVDAAKAYRQAFPS